MGLNPSEAREGPTREVSEEDAGFAFPANAPHLEGPHTRVNEFSGRFVTSNRLHASANCWGCADLFTVLVEAAVARRKGRMTHTLP